MLLFKKKKEKKRGQTKIIKQYHYSHELEEDKNQQFPNADLNAKAKMLVGVHKST